MGSKPYGLKLELSVRESGSSPIYDVLVILYVKDRYFADRLRWKDVQFVVSRTSRLYRVFLRKQHFALDVVAERYPDRLPDGVLLNRSSAFDIGSFVTFSFLSLLRGYRISFKSQLDAEQFLDEFETLFSPVLDYEWSDFLRRFDAFHSLPSVAVDPGFVPGVIQFDSLAEVSSVAERLWVQKVKDVQLVLRVTLAKAEENVCVVHYLLDVMDGDKVVKSFKLFGEGDGLLVSELANARRRNYLFLARSFAGFVAREINRLYRQSPCSVTTVERIDLPVELYSDDPSLFEIKS